MAYRVACGARKACGARNTGVPKNPQPRESPVMQKRTFPAVLRFNKVRQGDDPRKFMLHEVMLYRPLRCEVNLDNVEEIYDESIYG